MIWAKNNRSTTIIIVACAGLARPAVITHSYDLCIRNASGRRTGADDDIGLGHTLTTAATRTVHFDVVIS